jgi:DNA polymerase-3 subunit alpha
MAFVQFSDATGVYEVTFFSETLGQYREQLVPGQTMLVKVSAEHREGDEPRLTVQSLEPLDNAAARASKGLDIHLTTPAPLESLKTLLGREGRGRGRIRLIVALDDGQEVEFDLGQSYKLSPEIRRAIKAVPGVVMQDR